MNFAKNDIYAFAIHRKQRERRGFSLGVFRLPIQKRTDTEKLRACHAGVDYIAFMTLPEDDSIVKNNNNSCMLQNILVK